MFSYSASNSLLCKADNGRACKLERGVGLGTFGHDEVLKRDRKTGLCMQPLIRDDQNVIIGGHRVLRG